MLRWASHKRTPQWNGCAEAPTQATTTRGRTVVGSLMSKLERVVELKLEVAIETAVSWAPARAYTSTPVAIVCELICTSITRCPAAVALNSVKYNVICSKAKPTAVRDAGQCQ